MSCVHPLASSSRLLGSLECFKVPSVSTCCFKFWRHITSAYSPDNHHPPPPFPPCLPFFFPVPCVCSKTPRPRRHEEPQFSRNDHEGPGTTLLTRNARAMVRKTSNFSVRSGLFIRARVKRGMKSGGGEGDRLWCGGAAAYGMSRMIEKGVEAHSKRVNKAL